MQLIVGYYGSSFLISKYCFNIPCEGSEILFSSEHEDSEVTLVLLECVDLRDSTISLSPAAESS